MSDITAKAREPSTPQAAATGMLLAVQELARYADHTFACAMAERGYFDEDGNPVACTCGYADAIAGVFHELPPAEDESAPLRCLIVGDVIRIEIGRKVLRFAAEQHPDFWDGESDTDVPNIKITDDAKFAREVVNAINDEEEDGSTRLTRMLDEVIKYAVEQGCEGVDHE